MSHSETIKETKLFDSEWLWVENFEDSDVKDFSESVFERFHENPVKPIIIHINSFGGQVHNLLAMLDIMDSIRSMASEHFSFITVTTGKACSAGAVLLSHGDYRFSTPNASIMIHQINGGTWGSHAENKVQFMEMSRLNEKMLTILHNNCKLKGTVKELEQQLQHDLYLEPEQAREFGLIDVIGYPKLNELKLFELAVLNGREPPKKKKARKKR